MTSLSRKALRHYHDIGILEPAHIDAHTGYRFYDTSQVDHAHIIRRFRSLGMSIPDIKALLRTDDAAARTEIITTHLQQMEVQLQQTRDTVGALRELLAPVGAPPTWRCSAAGARRLVRRRHHRGFRDRQLVRSVAEDVA